MHKAPHMPSDAIWEQGGGGGTPGQALNPPPPFCLHKSSQKGFWASMNVVGLSDTVLCLKGKGGEGEGGGSLDEQRYVSAHYSRQKVSSKHALTDGWESVLSRG